MKTLLTYETHPEKCRNIEGSLNESAVNLIEVVGKLDKIKKHVFKKIGIVV